MISSVKNVQILVSLLKQHNIKHVVISPGSRDFQFVHSVETDDFFNCYTVVDERSAGFFANGLSLATDSPVCVCCTSSTATSNYLPAVKDACETNAQLVLLTADRDYRKLYQMEDQMINQIDMYGDYVKCSVNIPIIRDSDDEWFSIRKINEALLELNHGEKGPVQINYQLMDLGAPFIKNSPQYRKIERINLEKFKTEIDTLVSELKTKKRIMVICGQRYRSDNLEKNLNRFFESFNAVVIKDNYSNLHSDKFLKTVLVTERMSTLAMVDYCPDMVITIEKHVWSFLKYTLQEIDKEFIHWRVSEDGAIIDPFKRLTKVFELPADEFFGLLADNTDTNNDYTYHALWEKRINEVTYPDMKYTNFYAIKQLCDVIPENSIVHASILNATRLFDFCSGSKKLRSFSNLGADGIDGCLPTFLGEASASDTPAYLISGDLSFFYGMNALNDLIPNNIHVFLINNQAGSEFHTNFGMFYDKKPSVDDHIAAGHHSRAALWAKDNSIKYYSATNNEELMSNLNLFVGYSDGPVLFEIFTNADEDTSILNSFYKMNHKIVWAMYYRKVVQIIKKKLFRRR
ncbi:MAG: hypothetical protein IKK03_07875 [Lachnospiraceae bacterium]|nr:hypothetical protein [Lachnospiraceae bacterium]